MADDGTASFFAGVAMGFLVTLLVVMSIMILGGTSPDAMRQKAVDHGAAEYYLDDENVKRFRWLDCDKEQARKEQAE